MFESGAGGSPHTDDASAGAGGGGGAEAGGPAAPAPSAALGVDRLPTVLGVAGRALQQARGLCADPTRLGEAELVTGLEEITVLRAATETLTVALLAESLSRGLQHDGGLSAHDWVGVRCPWLSRPEIADLVTVARAIDDPVHAPIARAARAGTVPVRRLARLVAALSRVSRVSTNAQYAHAIDTLLPVASDPRHSDRDLKAATDHLLAVALPDKDTDAAVAAARQLRGVCESSLAGGTLTRFVITCDAEGAALFRAVLASPLAAPAPTVDAHGQTVRDERTGTQRRYDALITMVARAMTCPEGAPTTAKAKIFLTMSYDALHGALVGAGRTTTGETLSATQVRRLACDADLVPVVLGTDSEVLDVGRASRLATPGQVKTLWLRDKGCTFPGCTTPPSWCQAHHVTWWSRGGPTSTTNLALLCGRHHTTVHERDLTATITTTSTTWHL